MKCFDGKEKVWEVTGFDGNLAQVKWSDGASRWDNDSAGTYFLDQDWVVRKGVTKKGDALLSPRMGPFAIIGKKVLSFPLYVGKTWDFNSEDRSLMQGGRTNFYTYLKVIGCEEVGTRAGKYLALKIEARLVPLGGSSWDITYWWYSPDAKNIVKKELGQFYEPYAGLHGRPFRPPDYELMEVELK